MFRKVMQMIQDYAEKKLLDAMAGKPKDAHEWALVKTYMKGANLK